MAAAAERDAAAAAAAAAAERQREERRQEAEFLQQQLAERERQEATASADDANDADEEDSSDVAAATEHFEEWLAPLLEERHGIVGDTATMYVSFAVALLQLEEKDASTVEELAGLKRLALATLFGELSGENAEEGEATAHEGGDGGSGGRRAGGDVSEDGDENVLGKQCWEFWAREVLPHMEEQQQQQPADGKHSSGPEADLDGTQMPRGAGVKSNPQPEPEPEPKQGHSPEGGVEKRIDPSDGVAYAYASFEEVYGPVRAPALWIKAGELMQKQAAEAARSGGSDDADGGAYVPPHKKGQKKGSKKGVALSLDELGFLFQGPSAGGGGGGGFSSGSTRDDSWNHDHYDGGGGGSRSSWRSGDRDYGGGGGGGSSYSSSSGRLGGDGGSYRPSQSSSRSSSSYSSMSYGGLASSSSSTRGGGAGSSSRSSGSGGGSSASRPSSSTDVAHRMIMHVLRSQ